jgi:hypothetical protein
MPRSSPQTEMLTMLAVPFKKTKIPIASMEEMIRNREILLISAMKALPKTTWENSMETRMKGMETKEVSQTINMVIDNKIIVHVYKLINRQLT